MKHLRYLIIASLIMGGSSAFGQGTQVGFGAGVQDTSAPIEVSANELSVNQADGSAVATGDVIIGQGDMRLSAPRVSVEYLPDRSGIGRLEATGGVTIVSGPDAAEAQRADYDVTDGVIVMTGDVLMTQGPTALTAERMTINLSDGTARMQGRVKTILQSGNN